MENTNINGMALPTTDITFSSNSDDNWVCPEFKVSGVFSSHMVLQQEKPIKIWGFAKEVGSIVTGEFFGEKATGKVADNNKWEIVFSAKKYTSVPHEMKIYDDRGHSIILDDILIGDVWLIGGQSNAELTLKPCMALTPEMKFSENDNFRLFTQTQAYVVAHKDMTEHLQRDIINPDWCWKRPDEEASLEFSGMGWYFANEMKKHIDIPLGLIMVCAGGACLHELEPENIARFLGYEHGTNVCMGGYFNTLIAPFIPLQFKAMMFFQGESEGLWRGCAEKYGYELSCLVANERELFGFEFPFYNVQVSSYTTIGAGLFQYCDIIRMQQFDAQKLIPNSTLSVDMDLGADEGYYDWPHSPKKLKLGERLALLALAREYGIGKLNEANSPMPTDAKLSADKKTVKINFENTVGGLAIMDKADECGLNKEVFGFSFGQRDEQVKAKAVISGKDEVTVFVPENADITRVSYAFENIISYDNANLGNSINLPAPAFSFEL